MPAPVRKRNSAKAKKSWANAVAAVAAMYTPSVTKKRRFLPSRSVSQPKKKAPSTAPARYALADAPTSASVRWSAGLVFSAPETAPASVTSSPSSTQVMPSASTATEWKRPQGSRSRRAGTSDSKTMETLTLSRRCDLLEHLHLLHHARAGRCVGQSSVQGADVLDHVR